MGAKRIHTDSTSWLMAMDGTDREGLRLDRERSCDPYAAGREDSQFDPEIRSDFARGQEAD